MLPDLILLDIMMPAGIGGYEVCRRLKDNPETWDIPVLFISALGENEEKLKALKAGGVDYISKPFQVEEVLARVRTYTTLQHYKKELIERDRRLEKAREVIKTLRGISMQTCMDRMREYNDWIKSYADENNLVVLDLEVPLRSEDPGRYLRDDLTKGDGLHLNANAYQILDNIVYPTLNQVNWQK